MILYAFQPEPQFDSGQYSMARDLWLSQLSWIHFVIVYEKSATEENEQSKYEEAVKSTQTGLIAQLA